MWNDEIKQNIIRELNEQFDTISVSKPVENHSYADSIFSPITTNLFKPISIDSFDAPNYFETTIIRNRVAREVPVHTLAFSDSFESTKVPRMNFGYMPTWQDMTQNTKEASREVVYDMDEIIHGSNAITFSLTPEKRGVAMVKRASWHDIWFEDVSLIKNTRFGETVRKFCGIQINF